jgi:hypothetical protein
MVPVALVPDSVLGENVENGLAVVIGFRRGKGRSLQAVLLAVRCCSHRIASSICFGVTPYSEARSGTHSRALNLEETTAVEMPVPAITG